MRFIRGLKGETKASRYSIKGARLSYMRSHDASVAPSLVIELNGWRQHGVRTAKHTARLIIEFDEFEKMTRELAGGLRRCVQVLDEHDLFTQVEDAKDEKS
jgi:hypothetical protein